MTPSDFRRIRRRRHKLLQRVSGEQGHRCCNCGTHTIFPPVVMNGEKAQSNWATLERVLPGAFGGTYAYMNVVMYCFKCNNKGSAQISKIIKRAIGPDMKKAKGMMQKTAIKIAVREGRIDLTQFNHGHF